MTFDRGLPVARQVVHAAKARNPRILPVRQIVDRPVLAQRHEPSRGRSFLRNVRVEELHPQTWVQRQSVHRPGVLDVQSEVVLDPLGGPLRRVVGLHRDRRAVAILLNQIDAVLQRSLMAVAAGAPLQPALERVRAGDVRQRACVRVAIRRAEIERTLRRAPCGAGRTVEARNVARADARLRFVGRIGFVVFREAGFEEQLAAQRGGVLRLRREVALRTPDATRFFGVERRAFMSPELDDAVHVGRELVLRRHLPRQPHDAALDDVVVDGRLQRPSACAVRGNVRHVCRVEVVERIGDRLIDAPSPERREEPEAILLDRSTQARIEVLDPFDAVRRTESRGAQFVGEVVALPASRRAREEHRSFERVAAFLRNHVQANARCLHFGRERARLIAHLLKHAVVEVVLNRAVTLDAVDAHAVHLNRVVAPLRSVNRHVGLLHAGGAADVGRAEGDAGERRADRPDVAPRRHRIEQIARQHLLLRCALHIHDRRVAGDGDRLLDGADAQLGVDRGREVRRKLDAFAADRVEPGQRERDRIDAGPEIDDAIQTGRVGRHRPHALDERRTAGFHGDPGQHGAGRILDRAGNRALCKRGVRIDQQTRRCEQHNTRRAFHVSLLANGVTGRRTSPPIGRLSLVLDRQPTADGQ